MRTYVGGQEALNAFEFGELAYGFGDPMPEDFRDLFVGEPAESTQQRAARMAVAREVLAELQEQSEEDEVSRLNARYAAQLSRVVPLRRRVSAPEGKVDAKSSVRGARKVA
ncbi:tail fiber assembly protein [Streptomyces sp. NBC_01142]|uniref:hypothetical protein n=1 Tax=Streptomyces sp. NBC_01142 TaxID=2975865 RepID=UPI00224E9CF6|nr:hypothetical protein [Streptomyces sp. NBC_01142]MCX4824392.1 tail fiber assembly protein [Streptomyces sp. NBC_01142]